MFKTILVPTDGSPLSDKVINAAVEYAKLSGSRVIGISVAEPYPFSSLAEMGLSEGGRIYEERALEVAEQRVGKVATAARASNVPCETVTALSFSPYEEIINAAQEFGCDVIFMGSHGRKGLDKLFIGSETQRVLANSTIPVLVFR